MPTADNYYPEMGDEAAPSSSPPSPKEPSSESESSDQTALVSLSFFGKTAPEPGETCTVRVTHVYDDEAEVEYVSKSKGAKRDRPREGMPGAMDRLEMMAE